MRAVDCINPLKTGKIRSGLRRVDGDLPLFEVLPLLLDSPDRELFCETEERSGVIDEHSLLEGMGKLIAHRDDSSIIEVRCPVADYSASSIAHAVEDADAHLVDLLSCPADEGHLKVTIRARHSDPSAVVRSLERYGFEVIYFRGSSYISIDPVMAERLFSLQTILNV